MRSIRFGLGVHAVVVLGMAACAQAGGPATPDPDRAVSSSGQEGGPARPTQGIVGRLVSPAGQPLDGARIVAQSLDDPTRPIPEIAILSDAAGRFVWPLGPGSYRISAVVDGREMSAADAVVRPGRVTTVELRAAP